MKKVLLTLTMLLFAFTGVMRASAEQGNVRADQVIEQGFEDGLGDWTMNHCHSSSGPTSSYGGNTGNYAFRFYYTANYPQYLISPELDDNDGVNFTFYAARYSSNYPETFKVGYSSTTNDPTEFTWDSEVTCTTMYGAGAYQEYSYDFPAGTKYVSIACTSNDQFYMFVDDITVTATEPAPGPTPGGIVEVTIGDPTSTTTNSYLPGYTLYDYAISQQIYTADEIGVAGTINTLTMWLKNSSSYARNINVYMKEVEATEFASTSAWESFTASDMVASFTMPNGNSTPIEVALDLSTPFEYSGSGSLAICFQDVTGQWSSGLGGVEMDATGNQAIYAYRDGTVFDPSNPGVNGTLLAKKNVIRLSIMTGGGAPTAFATVPDVLDLGYRPNGAWMAPYVFNLKSNVGAVTVNALDFSGNYFTYNAELPATVSGSNPLEVAVSTGTAEAGEVNSTITVLYSGNDRDAEQLDIKATAYDPVEGDVYEQAIDVTSFPYNGTAPAEIYKNYELPIATEGADAVYKLTFANDVLLTAGTTGADGVAAIYPEDFNGQPGPMADNNYVYEGPTVNPGPTSLWYNYAYTGTNTWYGTSAGGGFYFGYKISTDVIAAENLAGLTITTVEAAAREAYPYYCFIIEGGADPFEGNMIGMGTIENPTALYFFDINLEEPVYISGNEDVWVIFYSDSPYAAYCGRYPVDTQNGKIWTYNPNASSPAWTSNVNYTPVIYCHMVELPTGRTATMDLAKMEVKKGNGVVSEVAEAEGNVMNVAKAQIANNNSRDVVDNNIEDMFVPAGTYYLAVASTDAEFPVSIATAEVPAPEQAVVLYPFDGETNVEAPYLAEWVLGDYTLEMQVLVGTQYPPQTALIDWTSELVESAFIMDLEPNQSYFMQVNERNATGTTMGEIIAFTTPIDPVEGFAVENDELYPGDAAVFTWTANSRTLKGYNLYKDGIKVNEAPIVDHTYSLEGLEYNMEGYDFQVSAVYDAGESALSDIVTVYMTGNGSVSGAVYDIDEEHPVANATVEFNGVDEHGANQTFTLTTGEDGTFTGEILAGTYVGTVATEGYDMTAVENILVNYDQLTDGIIFISHEFYYPLGQITATEQENDVLVEWSWDPAEMIVDFETGDFSQAEFTLPAQYAWTVTTTNPYEGTYCMKSTCEGQASASSIIEATVEVPFEEAKMGFYVRTSSEANYDKFHFYIDGVEKGQALSGENPYAYKEFTVTAGVHTYKWEYTKDSSVNSNDDCIYVDNICMYRKDEPVPPTPGATTYTFDNSTMEGWTTIDANNDGYDWVLGSEIGGVYLVSGASLAGSGHDESADMVCSGSYSNATNAAITPDNYLVAPAQINVQAGASISFYACAQDASYAAEHFGVAVSTTTATASAFTMVQEWTMTAKNSPEAENHGLIRGTRAQGSWYQKTVDLSSYAGQTIWVAIRHFNCNDQFILNVDDITIYDGSTKVAPRNNREFMSYNLYRRNLVVSEEPGEPIATGIDAETYEYTDEAWASLPYGEWQWGIAATYDGYAPTDRSRETATFGFENGLEGWTGIVVNTDGGEWIHSNNNLGGYDYTTLAHGGTGFAMCYSYVDYDGAYDTDAYLVSPQKYSVDANSSITFWADNANDDYPENFSVCVSTAANPTAASFTQVWSGGAKGTGNGGAAVRRSENRYENWRSHEVSLAAYAGQEVWIAFHDVNYDMYEIWIDDVTITYAGSAPTPPTPPAPTGSGESEILWSNVIEKDMEATLTFNVNLNNGQSADGATVTIDGENNDYNATIAGGTAEVVVRKGDTYDITVALEGYESWIPTGNPIMVEADHTYDILLNEIVAPVEDFYVSPTGWARWEGAGGVTPTPPTPPTGILFEDDFEDGAITNWTTVDADGDGDTWQNATPASYSIGNAHSGTNCASSWSWNNVSMDPDNWMISPMVEGATNIQYYVATNTAYADHYGVYASSTGTNTSDFTLVFEETAGSKGGNGVKSSMTQGSSREMSAWMEKNIDLPAGTKYVAFRHWNSYDMNYLFIDDVTIEGAGRGDRAPISYKMMLDGTYVGETYHPCFQFDVDGMEEGEVHVGAVAPLYASGMGDWSHYTWTYAPCDPFNDVLSFNGTVDENNVTLTWTLPDGGQPTPPTPGQGQWYQYGTDEVATGVGAGGPFYWGVMFPAGTYQGNVVTKAATFEMSGYPFSGNVTIYNDGTTAPATAVGTMPVSVAGTADQWAEFEFAQPISIDPTKNLWIVFYNETSTTYPAAACTDAGDANARWVSLDGSSWMDLATAGLPGYSWIIKAYVATANKGEVQEITVPTHECNNAGVLSAMHVNNRNMWDLEYEFDATSGYQYGVASDGEYIYTSSWSASSTSQFYKYDMQGNFIEEFNVSGSGQCRGLTYDGQYFYGVANSSTIYCLDLANHTLVSTTSSAYGAMRAITYDPERDGFWVVGNWSGALTLVSRTGAIVQAGATPTSASDCAYYKDPAGVEHVFCFNNGTNDVDDYNIATNTITSAVFNFNTNPVVTGSSGGCFVGTYNGKTCFFGDIQQSPQHIAIYELDAEAPQPPVVMEGILGVALFRDGEYVAFVDANTTTYTDVVDAPGDYTYTVRVAYAGEPDVTLWAMSCGVEETVTIEPWAVNENSFVPTTIYPNPTTGNVTIEAKGMSHITVVNALGQVVYDANVDADMTKLNLGQFEAGLYMVRINTEAGVSVKRVTVVK